ncbi:MAG: site-specific integrase, partial [Candidatus Thermoplasmatota archaeon]
VPIPPPARACVLQYLQARTKQLKKFGIKECEPLIPYFKAQEKQDAYFSEGNFCRLKRKLQEIAGIKFKLKDFRSSYAQMLKDKNVNIEVISKALGHSSTKTTEKYYARIRDSYVSEIINRAWENVQNPLERFPKNRKMDFENCLSGYA